MDRDNTLHIRQEQAFKHKAVGKKLKRISFSLCCCCRFNQNLSLIQLINLASFILLGFEVMFIRLQIRARWDERTKVCTVKVCKVYVRQQSPKRFRCRFSSRTETISAATVNRRPGESTPCAVSRIGGEADWFWCRQPTRRLLLPPHGTKCHTRAVHRVTKACAASVEFLVKRIQLWSWFLWLQKWFEIITLPFGFLFFIFLLAGMR